MWKQAVASRGEERVPDEYDEFSDYDLPSYVGSSSSFHKLPRCPADASLARSQAEVAIVGAPFDEGASARPGSRFGPRAIRAASYLSGEAWSIPLGVNVFQALRCVDAGDAPVVPSRPERADPVVRAQDRRGGPTGARPPRPPGAGSGPRSASAWSTSTRTRTRLRISGAPSRATAHRCAA